MTTLYIDEQGAMVRATSGRLVVSKAEQDLAEVPFAHVERLVLSGNIHMTAAAVTACLKRSLPVYFLSHRGQLRGQLTSPLGKNNELRLAQYQRFSDVAFRLEQSKALLAVKLRQCIKLMDRHQRNHPDSHVIKQIQGVREALALVGKADNLDSLRGYEGFGARCYFEAFAQMVRNPAFIFQGRNRRPPKDPVNALLSLGYTLLQGEVSAALEIAGLDPYIGVYHEMRYGRPSLTADFEELFRYIVDGFVLGLLNRSHIPPESFVSKEANAVFLGDAARKLFYRAFDERMRKKIKTNTGPLMYRAVIHQEARRFASSIRDQKVYLPLTV